MIDATALVLSDRRGGIATLTLNDPARFNVLSAAMLAELQRAIETLAADADLRCLVIAASGPAFCAGHDLRELRDARDALALQALFTRCSTVMQALRALPVPVVARVQGVAAAAGCQLVAACDLAVAGRRARFAVSGINLGLFCSTPAVALSRAMPPKAAFDMLFTGRFIDAEEARTHGLVNRVVDDEALDAAATDYAAEIAAKSPDAVRIGKAMFYAQQAMSLEGAYRYAGEVMACNMLAEDAKAGVGAFLARRGSSAARA